MKKDFSLFLKDAQNEGSLKYFEDFALSSVSSMGTGGKARFFVTPFSVSALKETLDAARRHGVYFYVIGNATNVIFSDGGFDGAIISTKRINGTYVKDGLIYAECGAFLSTLSQLAAESSLSGFEGLISIPATVGGALVSNAGAFGSEISDTLLSFSVYLTESGKTETRTPKDFPFSYRHSHAADGSAIILSAIFSPTPGSGREIRKRMLENVEKRKLTQPLGVKSVGSFFKKPDYVSLNKDVSPAYLGKSAGELIDLSGLKGKAVGDASVSEKHAGFIINRANATTCDVLTLSEEIKRTVFEKTRVTLTEECVILPSKKS